MASNVKAILAYSPAFALLVSAAIVTAVFPPHGGTGEVFWAGGFVAFLLALSAGFYALVVFFVRLHRRGGPNLPYAASFIHPPRRG